MEDFHDLLARLDGFQDVLAERLFLHLGDEILGDGEFDIGLEQCDADFTERVGNVLFRDPADATEVAEGLVEAI